jgi:hypothetical protein
VAKPVVSALTADVVPTVVNSVLAATPVARDLATAAGSSPHVTEPTPVAASSTGTTERSAAIVATPAGGAAQVVTPAAIPSAAAVPAAEGARSHVSSLGARQFVASAARGASVAPHPSQLPFTPLPAPAPLLPPTLPFGCPMEAGGASSSLLHPGAVNPGGFVGDGSGASVPDLVGRILPTGEQIVARPVTILVPPA